MRHKWMGIGLLVAVVWLVGGPGRASGAKSASEGGQVSPGGSTSQPGRVLALQVINQETKEPVAGVDLEIRFRGETRKDVTDGQGRCRIEYGPQEPPSLSIRASKQGLVPTTVSWGPGSQGTPIPNSYTLALEPATSLGGLIQDEDGQPIAGVTVDLLVSWKGELKSFAAPGQTLKTDANGRWRCDTVPAKLDDVLIRLDHPDYIRDAMYGMTPKPPLEKLRDRTGVMILKKGITVTGRVLDTNGRPIERAWVMQGTMRLGTEYPTVGTDQDGRFHFDHVRPGELVLTVQAKGYAPDLQRFASRTGGDPVEFRLEPARTLKGRIVDQEGQPVAGAFVAVDGWRGYRSLQWRVNTDAQGRFQWDEAPADEVLVDMGKPSYMSIRRYGMTASDREYSITMLPMLRVRGRVVDKETGQPIPKFTVASGIDFARGQSPSWDRRPPKAFTDGQYEITFSEPYPGHVVRVEAEGYVPEASRAFTDDEGEVTFDVALKKGVGLGGTVCLADGTPVPGAEVILCTGSQGAYIENGRNQGKRDSVAVETGPEGRFRFPPQTDAYVLVVLHDKGYAQVTDDELTASPKVTLRPWGRVEGHVLLGSKPGVNQEVQVLFGRPPAPGAARLNHTCRAVTDKDGRFVLDRVPPGPAKICREIRITERSGRFTDLVPLDVKAGETVHVTIGGAGRPVIGQVVIPEALKDKLDSQTLDYYLVRQSSDRSSQSSAFKLGTDGTFRAENIPAGDYCLYLLAYGIPMNPAAGRGERLGSLTHPFTVPDLPGGRSDEPLDLGTLELPVAGAPVRASALLGKPLPDLTTLSVGANNYSPVPMGETAGKALLICLFDMDQRPSRNTLVQLAKRAGELKDKGIVIVAVQGSQADETKLKDWVRQTAIPLPVGLVQGDENKVRAAWGVRSLPWLILTDAAPLVRAEGFSLDELDGILARTAEIPK